MAYGKDRATRNPPASLPPRPLRAGPVTYRTGPRVAGWLESLASQLADESAGACRTAFTVLATVFGAAAVLQVVVGAPPIAGPWDEMEILDGAWRMFNGQVPHVDYHNPIGPLIYVMTLIGMRLAAPATSSIVYGIVIALAVLVPWAWAIASRRLPAWVSFAVVLFLGFLVLSPRPLSYGIRETTNAMLYNRLCYALLIMLILALLLPPRASVRARPLMTGISCGLILGLMFYCKITYFLVGSGFVALSLIMMPARSQLFLGVVAGAALVGAVAAASIHVSPGPYLADVATAAVSQSLPMRLRLLTGAFIDQGRSLYLFALCSVFWAWSTEPPRGSRRELLAPWMALLLIGTAALVIDSGNAAQTGAADDPLMVAAGIVLIELHRRRNAAAIEQPGSRPRAAYLLTLLLVLPIVCGATLLRDVASFMYTAEWNLTEGRHFDAGRAFHARPLEDFRVPDSTRHVTAYWPARDHPANINDGIDLLRRNLRPGDTVTVIAYTNPFSFALGLPPAHDGPQWWDLDISFDAAHHAPPEGVLGAASLVMVPGLQNRFTGGNFETVDTMLAIYGAYLAAHFELADVSTHWRLYRRRSA